MNTPPDQDVALIGKGKAPFNLGKYADAFIFFENVLAMNSSDVYISNEALKNKKASIDALKKGENLIQLKEAKLIVLMLDDTVSFIYISNPS